MTGLVSQGPSILKLQSTTPCTYVHKICVNSNTLHIHIHILFEHTSLDKAGLLCCVENSQELGSDLHSPICIYSGLDSSDVVVWDSYLSYRRSFLDLPLGMC